MEWRLQSAVAFQEAQRWLEEVTKKPFGGKSFRVALENGVLLCDLINTLKPGVIKRINRLSTPIAGLDNVNVFLKACEKLGLKEAQLFHPGDLQDVSSRVTVKREETNRRLKNVLITIYWLGRKAQRDPFYTGPQLNLKAFKGLLGIALSKALEEANVRDSRLAEGWIPDREDLFSLKQPEYRREDSVESLDSLESRTLSVASDCTIRANSEGCCRDAEAEHCFRMSEDSKGDAPSRERVQGPSALRRRQVEQKDGGPVCTGPLIRFPMRHSQYIGSKSMGDIKLEPIPQESDNCSSFGPLVLPHVHQRSVGKITLEPLVIHGFKQEPLQEGQDLSRWKSCQRSTNSDLHRKREEREEMELIASRGGASDSRAAQLIGSPEESPHKTDSSHMLSRETLHHSQTPALREKTYLNPQISNIPGPISDAKSNVGSAMLTGRSTTHASNLTTGMTVLADSTYVKTPDFAQRCSSEASHRISFLESFYASGTRMSATLPRGFRRSEGSTWLSMGVTPRPFGAKPSKASSLSRVYSMDDSHKSLISGQRDHFLVPSFLSSQGKVMTSADTSHSCSSTHPISIKKDDDSEERKDGRLSAPPIQSFVTKVTMASSVKQKSPVVSEIREVKVGQSEMRVCLNRKPNSGRDFGFKAYWDSTGACINFVQAGSPAEVCGLQMGDEIVALGGCRVADMNYEQFKGGMQTAQQNGALLMDIRRHGLNDWGSNHPSLPYKSHKTINLTSSNSTLVGRPEHVVSVSTSPNSPVESVVKTQINGLPANGGLSNIVNGSFQEKSDNVKNKDYEYIVLKNHRRKLEFFMQKGGSESAISDLQVPSISSSSSSRWSWDHEEERKRQEKWQMEQERLLQEKYQRDQEKLEEEWRRAQQEVYGEELRYPEEQKSLNVLSNGNTTPYIPPPYFNQATAPTALATNQIAEKVDAAQNRQAAVQTAGEQKTECDSTTNSQWSEESYWFAKLTVSDRTKSKSTPALQRLHKQDAKGSSKKKGRVSKVEQERQQILEEMRKKTQLLTDSSWIRQRSTNINKEPINVGTSIRRFESLENLYSTSSLSRQSCNSSAAIRPHSALGSNGTYRSGRNSLGPGSAIFNTGLKQSSTPPPITAVAAPHPNSQQCGSVSAAGLILEQGVSPEPRSESDTDSSSVTAATADLESVSPTPSEQNALQQIEEECTTATGSGITAISTT